MENTFSSVEFFMNSAINNVPQTTVNLINNQDLFNSNQGWGLIQLLKLIELDLYA